MPTFPEKEMTRPRYRGRVGEIAEGPDKGRFMFEVIITNEKADEIYNTIQSAGSFLNHDFAIEAMKEHIQVMADHFAKAYGFKTTAMFHDKKDGDNLKAMHQV